MTKAIHRLVAEAWLPNPDNLQEIDHVDGNKLNNNVENLCWVTRGENIRRAYELNKRSATGINNARCETNEETVVRICELLQEGYTAKELRDIGFSYRLVRAIKSRQNWSSISSNYSFK